MVLDKSKRKGSSGSSPVLTFLGSLEKKSHLIEVTEFRRAFGTSFLSNGSSTSIFIFAKSLYFLIQKSIKKGSGNGWNITEFWKFNSSDPQIKKNSSIETARNGNYLGKERTGDLAYVSQLPFSFLSLSFIFKERKIGCWCADKVKEFETCENA